MVALLSVEEAQQRLLSAFHPLDVENLDLIHAAGRVLAGPVQSTFDIPSFDNSSMDGFAVRSSDVVQAHPDRGVQLMVVADIPAGNNPQVVLHAGQAARIMTGAPIPEGADAVVPVEQTDFSDRNPDLEAPKKVRIFHPVAAGAYIRPRGQDVHPGEAFLQGGFRLRPQEIGFLAMLGIAQVSVYRLPRVAVFSTGDELVPLDRPLTPGKIYDSNSLTLVALIKKYGGMPVNLGIIPDRLPAIKSGLEEALAQNVDLILSSAGVSVGAFDFVRQAVETEGHLDFWRVNMRPGKPVVFGSYRNIPYIGLPGNPVSAFVAFEVFVRLAIQKMSGSGMMPRPVQRVRLTQPIDSDGRQSYLRAIASNAGGEWSARLTGHQGSGNMRSLVQANALLLVPSGVKSLPIGAELDAWLFDLDG